MRFPKFSLLRSLQKQLLLLANFLLVSKAPIETTARALPFLSHLYCILIQTPSFQQHLQAPPLLTSLLTQLRVVISFKPDLSRDRAGERSVHGLLLSWSCQRVLQSLGCCDVHQAGASPTASARALWRKQGAASAGHI